MHKCIPFFVLVTSIALASVSPPSFALAQTPIKKIAPTPVVSFGTIGPDEQANDPRLQERRISVTDSDIHIGELLDQISAQTGVTLRATDRYHTAGWRLCLKLNGTSLLDTMNALRSAMSFKNAFWTWRRTETSNGYTYELVASDSQASWEESIRGRIQSDFEKRWEDVKATMKMSQSELDQSEQGSVAWLTKSKGSQLALKVLTTDLSASELGDLLHGTRPALSIPYARLSKQGRDFVDYRTGEFNQLQTQHGNSPNTNLQQGITVSFETDSHKLTPSLMVLLDEIGGYTYVGGTPFELTWRANMEGEYLLRDDTTHAPLTDSKLLEPADKERRVPDNSSVPVTLSSGRQIFEVTPFERRFQQLSVAELADCPSFSFIACLPQQEQAMPTLESPYGRTLGAYATRLKQFGIASKWNSGVLLLRYLPGITQRDSAAIPSYAMIRWVDEHFAAAPDGELSLEELIYLSTTWSSKEMLRSQKAQYPTLHSLAAGSARYYKALGKETPETLAALQSPEGLPTNRLSPALATIFRVDYPTTRSKTLRARLWRTHPTESERDISEYFEVFDPVDPTHPVHIAGFSVNFPRRIKTR